MIPKVSFVVAIYNVAQYIEQCVRSLYEQTLEDIEIILVDDCTPDNSITIALRALEDYPNRKSQVRVLHHEVNQGVAVARKNGISTARGKYLINFDGDDFADVRMAELLYNKAVEAGADLTICDYYRFKEMMSKRSTLVANGIVGEGDNVREDIITRRVSPYLWCMLIQRNIFDDNEILWAVKNMAENNILATQVAYYAKRVAHVDEPLYYYRQNPGSITKNKTEERCKQNMFDFKANIEVYEEFLRQKNVLDKYAYGIFVNKMRAKRCIIKYTAKQGCRKLWRNTFPEVNKVLLFGSRYYKPTYREWVWYFVIMAGLYPRLEKRLKSSRFKLAKEIM